MRLLLVIFLLVIVCSVQAQNGIGVRTGAWLAKFKHFVNDDYLTTSDPALNTEAGIFANLMLYRRISLVPEINFLHKGQSDNDGFFPTKSIYRQIELAMPVSYEYTFGRIRIFGKTGFTYSFLVGGYSEIGSHREKVEFGEESDLNRSDFGILPAGGIAISVFDSGTFFLEGRYRRSFLYTANVPLEDIQYSIKSTGYGINFGLLVSFNKE